MQIDIEVTGANNLEDACDGVPVLQKAIKAREQAQTTPSESGIDTPDAERAAGVPPAEKAPKTKPR